MSDTEKSDDILKIESKLLAVLETDLFDQESVKKAVESLIEVSEAVKEL